MTPRLKIAAQILPILVQQETEKSMRSPETLAHRALLLAEALMQCDRRTAATVFKLRPSKSRDKGRARTRRTLLLPSEEMMRRADDQTRH
jgi:hypothetical protein